jgi:hypothetical protein
MKRPNNSKGVLRWTPVYLRDLNGPMQQDFLADIKKMNRQEKDWDREIIVGYYLKEAVME